MWLIGVLAIAAPGVWMGLFTDDPRSARPRGYLGVVGIAYLRRAQHADVGLPVDAPAAVAAVAAMTCRLLVVVVGGWIATQVFDAEPVGLAVVTALGLATWAACCR
jgi:hypothetical protein